jgi:ABC-type polysaccharide/polyol phosphate export permease
MMPTQAQAIERVLQVDLSYFFRTKWLVATLVTLNLSDMLIAGLVYTNMMSFDYLVFFAPGVVVAGMFAAALDVGRRVYLGLSEGVTQYYLSLPMSLDGLAWAHILSAGLGGTIYGSILLGVAVLVVPKLASVLSLALIPFMFVVSMGLGGITAVLNLFTKGGDRYWVYADGVQVVLLGLSTVFYPVSAIESFLPASLVVIVHFNPLSQLANAFRDIVFSPSSLGPIVFGEMLGTSLILLFAGVVCYRHVFERVWEEGKV